jgi:hypothetical protein
MRASLLALSSIYLLFASASSNELPVSSKASQISALIKTLPIKIEATLEEFIQLNS